MRAPLGPLAWMAGEGRENAKTSDRGVQGRGAGCGVAGAGPPGGWGGGTTAFTRGAQSMRRANRRSTGGVPAAVSGVARSSGLLLFIGDRTRQEIGPSWALFCAHAPCRAASHRPSRRLIL
jgi:hypothetical protein